MKNYKKINKQKILIPIFIIVIIILIFIYGNLIQKKLQRNHFVKQNATVYQNNEEEVFKLEKIILCNSANAIDKSQEQNLQDLSIYQYTDIAIYINNGEELTNKNTIKELYIDNISLDGDRTQGQKSLNYKNLKNFGLKQQINEQPQNSEKIDFNIIYTNEQNQEATYMEPTFYTDCSNPITLEYVNYNLVNGYKLNENESISFDGSVLQKLGIEIDSIECKVKFRINIVNNQDEKYSCPVNINIPLSDIYEGTTMKTKNTKGAQYVFFRE